MNSPTHAVKVSLYLLITFYSGLFVNMLWPVEPLL
jgi:hypothetical protein